MMGTLELKGLYWGLIKAGDGTIHRVLPGNYLGMNHGKINRILGDRIELTEITADGAGGWVERQAAIALAE
jgi:type IV pilus assembly protein PilP